MKDLCGRYDFSFLVNVREMMYYVRFDLTEARSSLQAAYELDGRLVRLHTSPCPCVAHPIASVIYTVVQFTLVYLPQAAVGGRRACNSVGELSGVDSTASDCAPFRCVLSPLVLVPY